MIGKIISFDPATNLAVVKPEGELPEMTTVDAHQIHLLKQPKVGDEVTFLVSYLNGKPVCFNLRDASYANVPG